MYLKLYVRHINFRIFHVYWMFPATGNMIAETHNETLFSMLDCLYKLQLTIVYYVLHVLMLSIVAGIVLK